jgi:hypothetical protein
MTEEIKHARSWWCPMRLRYVNQAYVVRDGKVVILETDE